MDLQGRHMKKNRNSRTLECAARWRAERDEQSGRAYEASARTIFENMEFKNGNLYKNYKKGMSFMSFVMRMQKHPAFKVRRGRSRDGYTQNVYSCTRRRYDLHWKDIGRFWNEE